MKCISSCAERRCEVRAKLQRKNNSSQSQRLLLDGAIGGHEATRKKKLLN
jgi:hypothetical protein